MKRMMLVRAVFAAFSILLASCSLLPITVTDRISKHGVPYTLHLNDDNNPCPYKEWNSGCTSWEAGRAHVWTSSIAPSYIFLHEEAHVDGMRHEAWVVSDWYKAVCTVVTASGIQVKYQVADVICITERDEQIIGNKKAQKN
jgi:hypothetical protein